MTIVSTSGADKECWEQNGSIGSLNKFVAVTMFCVIFVLLLVFNGQSHVIYLSIQSPVETIHLILLNYLYYLYFDYFTISVVFNTTISVVVPYGLPPVYIDLDNEDEPFIRLSSYKWMVQFGIPRRLHSLYKPKDGGEHNGRNVVIKQQRWGT